LAIDPHDMHHSMLGTYDDNFYFNNPVDSMASEDDPWLFTSRPPLPNEFVNSLCCYSLLLCCLQKNAWQRRKDIVNLTADVVRIKASAEQSEDQGTSVSASMAQAPSRDFLYAVVDPQPPAYRKRGLT
jgi:hypothetical protein